MIEILTVNEMPTEPYRAAMLEWLRRHGVDPSEVPLGSTIERHPDTARVVHEVYLLDQQGERYVDPATDEAARGVRVVQPGAPPAPFPELHILRCLCGHDRDHHPRPDDGEGRRGCELAGLTSELGCDCSGYDLAVDEQVLPYEADQPALDPTA